MDNGNLSFDFDAVLTAIEDRFLSGGPGAVVGDRPEAHIVHARMDEHMLKHGVPVLLENGGIWAPAPRCPLWPCAAAGLAFGAFEMRWFAINASDLEEASLCELAAARLPLREEVRQGFRAMAERRREAIFSRPLVMQAPRRPPVALEQAVSQHLRTTGGLSHSAIAGLMGSTVEATRKRCAAPDVRSAVPYVDLEERGAA
jgi:hypothetical protein